MKFFLITIIEFFLTKHYFLDLKNHVISNDLKKEIDNLNYHDISNFSGAKKEWHNNLNELINKLKKNRIKDFLKIDVVRRTMYVARANYTLQELNYLPTKKYLKENFVGSPIMFYKKPIYSSQRIHHQFLLYSFDIEFENFINDINIIFEFGGGYGSMCENIFRHNYKGEYVIFDFKEFSVLQKYYLNNTLSHKSFNKIMFINDLKNSRAIENKINSSNSLFIATWSLSETDLKTRNLFDENILKNFDYYLIAFQPVFNEIDNLNYFKDFMLVNDNINWQLKEIENSISNIQKQYFLFGKKK